MAVATTVLAADTDGDGVLDDADNCVAVPNEVQLDGDSDGDRDGDGVVNATDNCPADANTTQTDTNTDGVGDICDHGPDTPDNDDVDRRGCAEGQEPTSGPVE